MGVGMQATLVTLGVVAVLAAIVGGGLKAAGVDIPVLRSLVRQVLLGMFGLALLVVGLEPWNWEWGGDASQQGEQRFTVAVAATQEWTPTAIDLEAGDQLAITAEGEIRDDIVNHPDRRFSPEGEPDPGNQHTGDPFLGFDHAALVAKIGEDGEVFKVGAQLRCSVTTRGRLALGINDGKLDDNDGQYDATVTTRPRGAGTSAEPCTQG